MTRIVIMARNEVGVIADISRALADADINIETISAKALGDKGRHHTLDGRRRRRAPSADRRRLQGCRGRLADAEPA